MITLNTTPKELFNLGLISVRAFNVCCYNQINTVETILLTEKKEFFKFRNCGKKTAEELEKIQNDFQHLLSDHPNKILDNPIENKFLKKFEFLTPQQSFQLNDWVQIQYDKLNVRTKKGFPEFKIITNLIKYSYSNFDIDSTSIKNCGKKSKEEIKRFISNFKTYFENITKDIDIEQTIEINKEEWEIAELSHKFPFLLDKECADIINFENKKGVFPFLFIVLQFIKRGEGRQLNFIREYYGFIPNKPKMTLDQIATHNGLSRERVRQIINQHIILPGNLNEEVRENYSDTLPNIIPVDSHILVEIGKNNLLEEPTFPLLYLLDIIMDNYTIIQIDDYDKEYLVNKELIKNVKVRYTLNSISKIIELQRTQAEKIDILKFIKSEKRVYHKEVSALCSIFANFLKIKYQNINIQENRFITIFPNKLDISKAIEEILSDKGSPMSIKELFLSFNTIHPQNRIPSLTKFKPYILRNDNLVPKGKSGIYILKGWDNHFVGSITDYIFHVLEIFGEPLHIDDLYSFVQQEFPQTTLRSVTSLMGLDQKQRFVVYEGNYYGLNIFDNAKLNLKERKVFKRYSFDLRLKELEEFVTLKKRMPFSNGDEEEMSLSRWINNIFKGNINATKDQLKSLEKFMKQNDTIPQNGFEYKFKQMCDQIKIFVFQNFTLPKFKTNPTEYLWFKKHLDKYKAYEDNRKKYFDDLLTYLLNFGYKFDC